MPVEKGLSAVRSRNETVGTPLGKYKSAPIYYFGTALAVAKHMSRYCGHKPDSGFEAWGSGVQISISVHESGLLPYMRTSVIRTDDVQSNHQ